MISLPLTIGVGREIHLVAFGNCFAQFAYFLLLPLIGWGGVRNRLLCRPTSTSEDPSGVPSILDLYPRQCIFHCFCCR